MGNRKKERAVLIIKALRKANPASKISLSFNTSFEFLITTILSAQCTDIIANRVASRLFKKYRNAKGLAAASPSILEKDIYSTGFYRAKAKNIIAASKKIVTCFNNRVPSSMKELLLLDGVGRKTANIILTVAFKKREGIAVDTHVKRLSARFGLTKSSDPVRVEQDLLRVVPFRYWLDFNYILVNHGRRICRARNPLCDKCVISKLCVSSQPVLSTTGRDNI